MSSDRIVSSFTRSTTAAEAIDGIDLSGKVAIVTGGSSGIGVETVRALASKGCRVFLGARSVSKGQAVADDIIKSTGNSSVQVLEIDLASLASVRAAAQAFLSEVDKLDLLINNAGIMANPQREVTVDGFEAQLGTNHIGHFLFTCLLVPALVRAAPSRIVNLSSCAHNRLGMQWADPMWTSNYNKWGAYAQSKTANVLFSVELDRRLRSQGVTANALHPGGIQTGLQVTIPMEEQVAMGWIDKDGKVNAMFKSIEQGASTTIFVATSPLLDGIGGRYFEDCNEAIPHTSEMPIQVGISAHALDVNDASRLWTESEKWVGETFDFGAK